MSGPQVVNGAMLMCSFGTASSSLGVLPMRRVMVENQPPATISDCVPIVNIRPFGMCTSLANPAVAAATAAALGVLTPQPCLPATMPWKPGSASVRIGGSPALTPSSTCQCSFGGVVTIGFPGTMRTLTG